MVLLYEILHVLVSGRYGISLVVHYLFLRYPLFLCQFLHSVLGNMLAQVAFFDERHDVRAQRIVRIKRLASVQLYDVITHLGLYGRTVFARLECHHGSLKAHEQLAFRNPTYPAAFCSSARITADLASQFLEVSSSLQSLIYRVGAQFLSVQYGSVVILFDVKQDVAYVKQSVNADALILRIVKAMCLLLYVIVIYEGRQHLLVPILPEFLFV